MYKMVQDCIGFDWNEYNIYKNLEKHKVSPVESEQIFFNKPFLLASDVKHSQEENRYFSLGRTDSGRKLFVVFIIRKNKIRIISSRDMSKKEKKEYEKHL